jgi:hypothetical protein
MVILPGTSSVRNLSAGNFQRDTAIAAGKPFKPRSGARKAASAEFALPLPIRTADPPGSWPPSEVPEKSFSTAIFWELSTLTRRSMD